MTSEDAVGVSSISIKRAKWLCKYTDVGIIGPCNGSIFTIGGALEPVEAVDEEFVVSETKYLSICTKTFFKKKTSIFSHLVI